jgi:hypothetical protein
VPDRQVLERDWLDLTRHRLPALAEERGWPVRNDHCFQRILLDAVCGGAWYGAVSGRPAYRHIAAERLEEAVALARAVDAGTADLHDLNSRSLAWRAELRQAARRR